MIRRNSVNWQGDESMAAIRAGQGLLVGLLRCGHCGRKLHVRYWGGSGTNARYLCKGDYDDGGQYCLGFGGRKVKILERAETMGDVLHAPNRFGKTLRFKCGPCNVVLRPFWNAFPWIARSTRNHDWIQADRVF